LFVGIGPSTHARGKVAGTGAQGFGRVFDSHAGDVQGKAESNFTKPISLHESGVALDLACCWVGGSGSGRLSGHSGQIHANRSEAKEKASGEAGL